MTAQVSDMAIYNGIRFNLTAYSDGEPFFPQNYGYNPVVASTACWRGYLCEYKVENETLLLDKLHINHQYSDHNLSQKKPPPDLNGSAALLSKESFIGRWVFKSVNLPLKYTGGLIITRNFIRELYVHMGFHPAWKFEEVHELVFESGKLKIESDLSDTMAEVREKIKSENTEKGELPLKIEIEKWIEDCFRRDYKIRMR